MGWMNVKKIVLLLVLIPLFTTGLPVDYFVHGVESKSTTENSEDYSPRNVSIKGKLVQSQPFINDIFWTILQDDKGVLVATSENGIIVIRFDFQDHDKCYDRPNTFCLIATLTETKNTVFTKVGDQATIILEYPDKLTFSILSGELVTNNFDIEIKKLRELN